MTNLIIGAGLSGLTLAERLANDKKERVLIIDRREQIGGNCADVDMGGILVHKFGAHIFHTSNQSVWEYITRFGLFYPYMHRVLGQVWGQLIAIPFNLNALYAIFPTTKAQELESKLLVHFAFGSRVSILELRSYKDLQEIADFIYENVFLHYTLKQWQCAPSELDSSVFSRVPILISKDDRYFPNDTYQGIPLEGYSALFAKMLQNPLIELRLNTQASDMDMSKFDRVFYSGAIDEYFSYELGELPYRSLELKTVELDKEYFGINSVINYPNNYDFTRIIEHKYFLDTHSPHTIITYEFPKSCHRGDERYYPMPTKEASALYAAYERKAKQLKNVFFIGRLGAYKYYDMDKAIEAALALYATL